MVCSQFLPDHTVPVSSSPPTDSSLGDRDLCSSLCLASARGRLIVAELLIEYGADVNTRNQNQETPLELASAHGELEIIRLLLTSGASVDLQDAEESTLLHRAAQGGHLDILTLLLKSGADVNIQNSNNKTPLDLALDNGRLDAARCLAEWMGNADSLDHLNLSPDSLPGVEGPTFGHGTGSDIPDERRTSLHDASSAGDLEIVRSLLEVGAHVNERDTEHATPLIYASRRGRAEVAKLLIKYGADVNAQDRIGWTALQAASRYGHADVVGLLLNHSADVNAMKHDQSTALHLALVEGTSFETVKALLEKGADVHVRNELGRTPFQMATPIGDRQIMQSLLEFGAHGE